MEFDSIIYIVIAIGLAIINAVAQKKKKTAAGQQKPSGDTLKNLFDPIEEEPDDVATVINERVSTDPFQVLFGNEEYEAKVFDEVEPEPEFIDEEKAAVIDSEPVLSDYEKRMQVRAKEFVDFKHEETQFDFEKDSIANSAIGDALTLEEEEAAQREGKTDFIKEFDPGKAIVYSEIIKPKYFSVGVNN
jgi:hypothetical protein